ncbi:unnamed protein product, partial [Brenthis ino]
MLLVKIFLVIFAFNWPWSDEALSVQFPIGGLFNSKSLPATEIAFENKLNASSTKPYHGRSFHSKVVDSYSTALEICKLTSNNKGIAALVDARPTNGICDITCLLCNRLQIPHLMLGWELPATLEKNLFTFSYYPPPELVSKAYATLIKNLQWEKFSFFYEDDGSFIRLQEVIHSWPYKQEQILYKQLDPLGDNRETFKYVFKVAHMSHHILDCDTWNVHKYMKEIVQVDNSTQYQSFILTNLDSYMVDLKEIVDLRANVSTLHMTKSDDIGWKDINMDVGNYGIRLETALAADALSHLEKSISSLDIDVKRLPNPPPLCLKNSDDPETEYSVWDMGGDLNEALIKTEYSGFTGNISFDKFRKRRNFILYYSKLSYESQFINVGYWNSKTDTILDEKVVTERSQARTPKSLIRIASMQGKPYFDMQVFKNGTATYEGYAVDLIQAIFEYIEKERHEKYEYEFYRVEDYGHPIAGTKKWDGLIGELLEHKAELAICDITITSERNAVIDFSTPFMSLGISLLTKEPEAEEPDMFSFIKPLSLDVWLYLATTYIIVSFVLLICARMSQGDWVNPHPCNQNPENLQNIWSLYNCMWLTMGAIMTQGCDILPRAAGSRWVTGMWWFFALIVTASYTANMSTFLSESRRSNEITEVKDLADQNAISYGALYNASTYKFFETSNDTLYKKLWSVMKSAKPTVFTRTNDEGRERVQKSKGKYAFFMESTTIEYYMQRHCDLKMVGSQLDSKDYGIAMPKNSPYKTAIDIAIVALQQKGTLLNLKRKWWEEMDNDAKCQKEKKQEEDDSGSLQMKNTSGIFLVLLIGGVLGFFVAVIDFLLHAKEISVKEKITFQEALASEWRVSLDPRALHKPAAPPRSAAPSTASPSPQRERSQSRAVSVLRAATSFINFDEIY